VKYHAVRGILEGIGVPQPVAEPLAWWASSYKGGKPAPADMVTDARGQSVSVDALRSAGVSEAAIGRMRGGPVATTPSPSPTTPVATAPSGTPGGSPLQTSTPPSTFANVANQAAKLRLTGAEWSQLQAWIKSGVPGEQALARISATKALQQAGPFTNLPTDLDVARGVAQRNATGRWP
jgi:hypothetical protein